jgi:hypothetical protein
MTIKLACNLPIDPRHGAVMGAVFPVLSIDKSQSPRESRDIYNLQTIGGEVIQARYMDVIVISERPKPAIIYPAFSSRFRLSAFAA